MPDPYDPKRFLADPRVRPNVKAKDRSSTIKPTKSKRSKSRHHTPSTGSSSGDDVPPEPVSRKKSLAPEPETGRWPRDKILLYALAALTLVTVLLSMGMSAQETFFIPRPPFNTTTTALGSWMRSFKRRPDTRTIPPHIASYIERTVAAALKDPVGRRDFALAADGARIASKLTSPSDSFDTSPSQLPENILDEDLRSASCWSFPDTHGQVAIKLPDFIYPTHITIDHVPHDVAADIRRAPRDLIVWGVMEGTGNQKRYTNALASFLSSPLNSSLGDGPPITGGGTFLPLAAFEYSIHSDTHIQTFPIDPAVVMSRIYFGIFVVEIKSNWGAPSTRLYRVRIHGAEVSA